MSRMEDRRDAYRVFVEKPEGNRTLGSPRCKWQSNTKNIIIISIQPEGRLWQEPEPSQATGMAVAHCILGSFLGVGCHCFPPPLDIPTFASRCLHVQAT